MKRLDDGVYECYRLQTEPKSQNRGNVILIAVHISIRTAIRFPAMQGIPAAARTRLLLLVGDPQHRIAQLLAVEIVLRSRGASLVLVLDERHTRNGSDTDLLEAVVALEERRELGLAVGGGKVADEQDLVRREHLVQESAGRDGLGQLARPIGEGVCCRALSGLLRLQRLLAFCINVRSCITFS